MATSITIAFGASPTAPLKCDCIGAAVYLRFKSEYADKTREGTGVARGSIQSRQQNADGGWSYVIDVHEPDLVTPVPSLSGGMIQEICCQGCVGYANEALNWNEFGGRLVAEGDALTEGRIHVRRLIRPFRISDIRFWIDQAAMAPVTFQVYVNNVAVLDTPISIGPGNTVSSGVPQFEDDEALLAPEGATIEIEVLTTGSMATGYGDSDPAEGLEVWFFGHLNPGPNLLMLAGDSGVPTISAEGPVIELVKVDGALYEKTTYPNGQVFWKPGFTATP